MGLYGPVGLLERPGVECVEILSQGWFCANVSYVEVMCFFKTPSAKPTRGLLGTCANLAQKGAIGRSQARLGRLCLTEEPLNKRLPLTTRFWTFNIPVAVSRAGAFDRYSINLKLSGTAPAISNPPQNYFKRPQ